MFKIHEFVEGKGYFSGYLCLHCKKEEKYHKKDTKGCPDDLRKSHPTFSNEYKFLPNVNKPYFVKFIL